MLLFGHVGSAAPAPGAKEEPGCEVWEEITDRCIVQGPATDLTAAGDWVVTKREWGRRGAQSLLTALA